MSAATGGIADDFRDASVQKGLQPCSSEPRQRIRQEMNAGEESANLSTRCNDSIGALHVPTRSVRALLKAELCDGIHAASLVRQLGAMCASSV